MKPRERLLAALNHVEADRIPIDLASSSVTGMVRQAYVGLREALALPYEQVQILDPCHQLARISEDVLLALEVDTRSVAANPPASYKMAITSDGDYWTYRDEWGAKLRMPKEGGLYFDFVEFPVAEPTLQALDAYRWPDPDDPSRFAGLRDRARALYEETDFALVGTAPMGSDILARMQRTFGLEQTMMALVAHPDFAEAYLDRLTDIAVRSWENFLDSVGEYIQVAAMMEDLGTQTAPMLSPALYRRLIKPREARIVDVIKRKSQAKVFLHSCGAIRAFIPDFIEIGIDILNPIQVAAQGMEDTAQLKRDFGRHLVFWGGACDAQRVAPFATPEEVRAEVRRRIADLAPGGGYVFSWIHDIQPDVTAQNILAAFQTARDHRY